MLPMQRKRREMGSAGGGPGRVDVREAMAGRDGRVAAISECAMMGVSKVERQRLRSRREHWRIKVLYILYARRHAYAKSQRPRSWILVWPMSDDGNTASSSTIKLYSHENWGRISRAESMTSRDLA